MSKEINSGIEEVIDLIWTAEEENISPFSHYPGCGCTAPLPPPPPPPKTPNGLVRPCTW